MKLGQPTAHVKSLVWITSLHPSEQGVTRRIQEDLAPFLDSIEFPHQTFEPRGTAELLTLLEALAKHTWAGSGPIIHFDTHGSSEQGVLLAASGEFVPWPRLVAA